MCQEARINKTQSSYEEAHMEQMYKHLMQYDTCYLVIWTKYLKNRRQFMFLGIGDGTDVTVCNGISTGL